MDVAKYSEKLDVSSEEAIQLARSCSADQLTFKPGGGGGGGGWGIFEVLEHICLTDRIIHRIVSKPTEKVSPSNEIIGDTKLKRIIEERENKIDAPDIVKPKGDIHDVDTFEKLLLEQRDLLKHDLKSGKIDVDNRMVKHFYLGEMTISDWLNLIIHHTRRHLKQIEEIISVEKGIV